MGKITKHSVEMVFERNAYQVTCNCGWRYKATDRNIGMANGHIHIASQAVASNE